MACNEGEVTTAKRAALEAGRSQAGAAVASAMATLDLALQDQSHTLIRAPIGEVVGDRLMTIVPMRAL